MQPTDKADPSTHRPTRSMLWWIMAITVLSFALRLALIAINPTPVLVGDMDWYDTNAQDLIETGELRSGHWPLYPASLALIYTISPNDNAGARVAQAGYSMILVLVVYVVAERTFDRRAARISAGIVAFHPLLIVYSDYLLTETLYATLLAVGYAVTLTASSRFKNGYSLGWGLLAGLTFGVMALTRGTLGAALLPVSLVWLIYYHRQRALPYSAAALVVFAIVIAPWIAHNADVYGWATLSTRTGRDLYAGNNPMANGLWGDGVRYLDDPESPLYGLSQFEQAQRGTSEAIAWIIHNPTAFIAKGINAVRYLYELPRQQAYSYQEGFYENSWLSRFGWVFPTALIGLCFVSLLVFSVTGVVLFPRKPAVNLLLLLLIAITGTAFLTYGDNRFLVPMIPLLCIPAGQVLARPRATVAQLQRSQWAILAIAFLLLGVNWVALTWEVVTRG